MKELNPSQEKLIEEMAFELAMIESPCDMFPDICPPDGSGVREPRRPVLPTMPSAEHLAFAAVYDLNASRTKRRELIHSSGAAVLRINQLVGA